MGIKHQKVQDPSLAKPHAAGSKVRLIQTAEHKVLGTITHEFRELWPVHRALGASGHEKLCELHAQLLDRPVTPQWDRRLSARDENDLIVTIYVAGSQMVLNVMLAMQHFCGHLERVAQLFDRESADIGARMTFIFDALGIAINDTDPGYQAFKKIHQIREAIEHPKRGNVYSAHPTEWDQVPMNWFLTDHATKAYPAWDAWLGGRIEDLNAFVAARGPVTQTLTVERGVRSNRQFKKPSKIDPRQHAPEV